MEGTALMTGLRKWALGIAMVLAGATLICLALIPGLFSVAPKFSDLTTKFKPEMTAATVAQLRTDLSALSAAQTQFTTEAVPALATELGMTPTQLQATMQQQFPATSAGMAAVPGITAQFNQVLTVMDSQLGNFAQADSIPTSSISPSTIPWVLVVVGALLIVCGVFIRRWWRAGVALVIGALLIAVPLALSLPGKATAADAMNTQMTPLFTAQTVASAQQSMATMEAMGVEMQTKLIPTLAQMLNTTPAQLEATLAAGFPALGASLTSLSTSLGQFDKLVAAYDGSLADYNAIHTTQFTPIINTILATGGFVLLVGLLGAAELVWRRQAAPAAVPATVPAS
ncbi:MAG: hypothetical protein ABSA40_08530 [Candidatus Dormibacteria bacterium]